MSSVYISYLLDVNECVSNNSCDEHADCHDTDGSYWCECWAGFSGDGYNCIGRFLYTCGNGLIPISTMGYIPYTSVVCAIKHRAETADVISQEQNFSL